MTVTGKQVFLTRDAIVQYLKLYIYQVQQGFIFNVLLFQQDKIILRLFEKWGLKVWEAAFLNSVY